MGRILLILIGFTCWNHSGATNYYFSENGNDKHDGLTQATPWRNLRKIIQVTHLLRPGDSILLERGSKFKSSLDISSSGIYIGCYGSGKKPIISGALEIKKWIRASDYIWKAKCSKCTVEPVNLFLDERLLMPGRYPDEGFLTISGISKDRTTFSDSTLPFTNNHWTNAEIVVRTSRWTLEILPVWKYANRTFFTSTPSTYSTARAGYFIRKHLSTLTRPGEWFFNPDTKQIFIYLAKDVNPGDHLIEVSMKSIGLQISHATDVTVENLSFVYQNMIGVCAENSNNIQLKNITISHAGKNGLEVRSSQSPVVDNLLITDSNNNGVEWKNNSNGAFINNTIKRTGLFPGRGASGDGSYIALNITSDSRMAGSNLFQFNTIDSTGYSGIDFRTGNTVIKNNLITNFCLTKDDGGGIYTWHNAQGGNTIENNIILDGIGNGQGTSNPSEFFVHGIYIDDFSSQVVIKGNTLSRCSTSGIFLHNAKAVNIIGNTLFDNGNNFSNKEKGQLYIKLDPIGQWHSPAELGLEVYDNKWFILGETSFCVFISVNKNQDITRLGKFDRNQFSAQQLTHAVALLTNQNDLCSAPHAFSLPYWTAQFHYDSNSIFNKHSESGFQILSKNLVSRESIKLTTADWKVWPINSTITLDRKDTSYGPSLKVNVPQGNNEVLLYQNGFMLHPNKLYRLSLSVMGIKSGKLEFVPLMSQSPFAALGQYTCFSSDSTFKEFIHYFRPDSNDHEARLNFKSTTTFWINNISLVEIIETRKPEAIKLLFNPTPFEKIISLPEDFVYDKNLFLPTLTLLPYESKVVFSRKSIQ